jgi:RNA polymerase sigma-70 factor (ECF subfamily)
MSVALPARLAGRTYALTAAAPEASTVIDADRFAEHYRASVDRIYQHIRARVGETDLAEDLTAQTFLRAWQSIDRYRPVNGRPFIAWLFTIANNLIVDHFRRSRRELIGVKGDPRDSSSNDPERCALATDMRDEIRRAVTLLKPDQQLIVTLRLIDGLEYEQISAIMGKSPGALRVLLCRALNALRAELQRRGVTAV